jgi:hypothetical protein
MVGNGFSNLKIPNTCAGTVWGFFKS